MDRHVWWFRRTVVRSVIGSTFVAFAMGSVAALAGLLAANDHFNGASSARDIASAAVGHLAVATLVGQGVALARIGLALVANPLTWSYLRTHLADPPTFEPGAVPGEPDPVGETLIGRGLLPAVTVRDSATEPVTVFDIYQSSERLLTAAVSRETGDVSLLSGLSDGRIAHTAAQQVLPREQLVVNTVPGAGPLALLESHQSLLGVLGLGNVRPVAASPRVWLHALELELESYRQLGPVLGAFCNLNGARGLGRLLIEVEPDAVLDLAVPRPASGGREPGTSRLAEAFGASAPA